MTKLHVSGIVDTPPSTVHFLFIVDLIDSVTIKPMIVTRLKDRLLGEIPKQLYYIFFTSKNMDTMCEVFGLYINNNNNP